MKIVLTGITSLRNRGVEALVTTILAEFRRRLPSPRFVLLDRAPDYDAARLPQTDVRCRFDESSKPLYVSRVRAALIRGSRFVRRLAPDYQTVLAEIRTADVVCATGGDVFGSEYGPVSLRSHLAPLRVARDAGRPFYLLAHSIGPFRSETDHEAFLEVAREATGISVREGLSLAYCLRDLGLPEARVKHAADPAFLLPPASAERIPSLRGLHGTGRPWIGLAPSQAVCGWMNTDPVRHFASWCAVIESLISDLDAQVMLVPHVQEAFPGNDDRVLATELLRHFRFDTRVHLAGGDHDASDFKAILAQCDLVVAERMHAALAGLSSGVPTVAIGYSVKAGGILSDLFAPDPLGGGLLLPLQGFLDPTLARDTIRRAWDQRAEVRAALEHRLPEIRRRAAIPFEDVAARLLGGT